MSKSLARVRAALQAAGIDAEIRQMPASTRTAAEAAAAAGCEIDQIVKSIILRGETSGHVHLFLTAGGNRIDTDKAGNLAGEPLSKADAALIRAETGFAIGGVAPVGLLTAVRCYMDPRLTGFALVWAAAGTPQHIFAIPPGVLLGITSARLADFTS